MGTPSCIASPGGCERTPNSRVLFAAVTTGDPRGELVWLAVWQMMAQASEVTS